MTSQVNAAHSQPPARQVQGRAKVPPAASPHRLDREPPTEEAELGEQQRAPRLAALGRQGGPGRRRAPGGRGARGDADAGCGHHDHQRGQPYAATASGAAPRGAVDESKSQRPNEHLLTGDTASKVRAAALARYPGATVLRVETDSDGVYEAHLTTADGQRVTVEVGKDFKVTGLESAPRR